MSDLLIQYFRNYNIWFLSILIILGCVGIPTGSTLLVIAAGAFAYAGEFNIGILLLEIWIFACIGDSIAYIIWRVLGNKILSKYSKLKAYFHPKIVRAETYLKKHGKTTIFFTRFLIAPMGPFVNAAAGVTEYKLLTFSSFVGLGELVWTCIYLGLGYWFGDSWETIIPIVTQFSQFLTYIIILSIILYFFIKTIRTNKRK
jgi:membrane-associated protein